MKTNFRVVIDLRDRGDYGSIFMGGTEWSEKEALAECNEMLAQISRHVDGVTTRNRPRIEWDEEEDE
ncbi:hypothetical protein KAW64_05255 [bacterium]|nr:hypothetical protein [bacterium]